MSAGASVRRGHALAVVLLTAATIAVAVMPEIAAPSARLDIRNHHLAHALIMAFGLALGMVLAERVAGTGEYAGWLAAAILAPVLAMLVMAPATYEYIEQRPLLHAVDHLGLASLGVVTTYAGQRYARGFGWAAAIFLELMAVGAAFGYGVAPPGAAR